MKKATYREIPALLKSRKPFEGNSVYAINRTLCNGSKDYSVYSYDTCIYEEYNGKCSYFDDSFYSRTTSRLQNILRSVFEIN